MTNQPSLLTIDPAWPWSTSGLGRVGLLVVAAVLVGLTVWTYRGVRNATRRRVMALIGIRLCALLLACVAVLRPSFAFQEDQHLPSLLLFATDSSESMT